MKNKINNIIKNSIFEIINNGSTINRYVYMNAEIMNDEDGSNYISIGNDIEEIIQINEQDNIKIYENEIHILNKGIVIKKIRSKLSKNIKFEYNLLDEVYSISDDILDHIILIGVEDVHYSNYNKLYNFIFSLHEKLNTLFSNNDFEHVSINTEGIDLIIKKSDNDYLYSISGEEWFENITELYLRTQLTY